VEPLLSVVGIAVGMRFYAELARYNSCTMHMLLLPSIAHSVAAVPHAVFSTHYTQWATFSLTTCLCVFSLFCV
jgi:hypothetical protein